MPANYIVINSKFKPFSYAEMLQPVQMATLAHQEVENEYADLATKANVWDEMANEQTDPYAYKMYKTYSNDLEEQAGQLAREGLTPASRQNMLRMKQRYSSDIVPIEQAYNRRRELIDEQRKLLAQDNTLMFDRNASMLSLDDLIKNPQLTYQSYSGATLAKQVGTAAQNLAKQMRENPRKWSSILHGQYFETMMRKGYTPEEIILVSSNDPNAPKELRDIIEDAVGSSNIASWGDADTLNRAYEYARQGLWNAVGETQYQTLQNQAYLNPLQELQRESLGKKDEDKKDDKLKGINPTSLYTVSEKTDYSNAQRDLKSWLDKKWIGRNADGSYYLTQEGLEQANNTSFVTGSYGSLSNNRVWLNPTFRNFLKNVGAVDDTGREPAKIGYNNEYYLKGWSPSKMNQYIKTLETGYDATRATEFVHDYGTESEKTRAKDMIRRAAGNSGIQVVSYKGPEEGYTSDDGKTIDKKDFVENHTVLASKNSKYGQVFVTEDKEGNQYNIRVPEVHREHQLSSSRYYIAAEDAYKNMKNLEPRVHTIMDKINNGATWEQLTDNERQTMSEFYSYSDSYEDLLWNAEQEQGRITRAYSTDNLKIE